MDKIKDILNPLAQDQIEELKQELKYFNNIVKQIAEDEKEYPILKYSEEAESFLESLDKVEQEVSIFRDKLEYVPIKIAVYKWLMQEQYKKKICPLYYRVF